MFIKVTYLQNIEDGTKQHFDKDLLQSCSIRHLVE